MTGHFLPWLLSSPKRRHACSLSEFSLLFRVPARWSEKQGSGKCRSKLDANKLFPNCDGETSGTWQTLVGDSILEAHHGTRRCRQYFYFQGMLPQIKLGESHGTSPANLILL
jgi:hypothetical protein